MEVIEKMHVIEKIQLATDTGNVSAEMYCVIESTNVSLRDIQ